MRPSRHIAISFSIGLILWLFTKSVYAGLLCFASGTLVDADHIIEYIIHHGSGQLNYKRVYQASVETEKREGELKFNRLYLVFHMGEIAVLLWIATVITQNLYVLAIALGYSSHLILDCMANHMHPSSYFMLRRIAREFNADRLFKAVKDSLNGKN